ncbi:unnamed protein product [Phytophthora fragariaefolia]|uniref:Unnamed protein product n=1 Tax=Phytophthora fragariaefolia TaxID=1490495 RepID=A0A9W7D0J3_9STRA|nr:unnamed protein product [Phytophthora fragariaefolia]
MDGYRFRDLVVLVWSMSPEHDVILGNRGLSRTNQILIDFKAKAKRNDYDEIYRVKITPAQPVTEEPQEIVPLLDEFADMFPDALPDGLTPHRRVEFELNMKPDAMPNTRIHFRLSKTEQDGLGLFVEDMLKKG